MDYNKDMKMVYYDSGEIEIVEGDIPNKKYIFYFNNIDELKDLINSSPELKKALQE